MLSPAAQVAIYGMNPKVGLLSFPPEEGQLNKPYSDDTARIIDHEVRQLVQAAYARTLQVGSCHSGWQGGVGVVLGLCFATKGLFLGTVDVAAWAGSVPTSPSIPDSKHCSGFLLRVPAKSPSPSLCLLQLLEEKKHLVEGMAQALLEKEVLGTGGGGEGRAGRLVAGRGPCWGQPSLLRIVCLQRLRPQQSSWFLDWRL
jgi:hypothetical protein